jgi:hypothetical protein
LLALKNSPRAPHISEPMAHSQCSPALPFPRSCPVLVGIPALFSSRPYSASTAWPCRFVVVLDLESWY